MAKLDLDEVRKLIRTEQDPAALQMKLKALIEEAHPAPAFRQGETMPMHEFERRFKKHFCGDIEPVFHQWGVMIDTFGDELTVRLGITPEGNPVRGGSHK